jgi:hypothetical protein
VLRKKLEFTFGIQDPGRNEHVKYEAASHCYKTQK